MPKKSLKSNPLISFVIRTKNEEKLIAKVLKSLYHQTYKNIEVIIVDSGSTDKTLTIIKNFPVRLIQIKPKEYNSSYALNLGISKTKGEYIGIVSGHSVPISHKWLANGLSFFKDQKIAGISGNYIENPIGYHSEFLGRLLLKTQRNKKEEFNPWLSNTNSLLRKKCWEEYPFDEKLSGCEDYDWACEMLVRGYNVVKIPSFSVFHSHPYLGRPSWRKSQPRWDKTCALIDKRLRPRKSYTKIKIK